MWTKRERVLAVLSGERPDRVPIFECMANDGILTHFGGAPVAVGDFAAVLRACSQCLDLCHPALVPQEPRQVEMPGGARKVVERWNTWSLPGSPRDERILIKDLKDSIDAAETWCPPSTAAADFRRSVGETNRHVGDMVYIHLGVGCPILPYDIEQGIYALADQPELIRRWNRAANRRLLRQVDAIADGAVAPVAICWDDIAFKGRLIYPPHVLEELFYPHLADLVELLHSRGVKVLFHSDGDVTEALPRLVECGIDGFNPLEISAGMDAQSFRQMCGKRVALVGGIDAVEILARGTPSLVAQKTRQLIDLFRDAGNLMVASASGEVDNSMSTENVMAMYETVWRYGKY
jgi:hypothetical protein